MAEENVFHPKLSLWRTGAVFGFGLLHGLGFASVLGEIGQLIVIPVSVAIALVGA